MTRSLLLAACLIGACLADSVLRADDTALRADLVRLFDAGWEGTVASRLAADGAHRDAAANGRADPRLDYAYALVLWKQRRYDHALKMLDAVLTADETNLAARENKVRLLMLSREYEKALVEIDRLSQLAAESAAEQLSPKRKQETLRLLGRMFGFLEGPAQGALPSATIWRVQRKVEARLSEEEFAIYEEARDGVLVRFEELAGQSQRGREEALAEKERQRDEARRDLDERRAQQQERRNELRERGDKLRQEIQDNQAEFAKAEQPLLDRLAQLERRAEIPRRELALLVTEADRLRALAFRIEDPVERDRLLFRADQLDILAARYDGELAVVERQAAGVNSQRAQLQNQYGRQNAALTASLQTIEKELGALQRGEKRIAIDEKRLERPLTSGTRAVRALEAEAGALTTYEPVPLEEERQRLLDSLEAKP